MATFFRAARVLMPRTTTTPRHSGGISLIGTNPRADSAEQWVFFSGCLSAGLIIPIDFHAVVSSSGAECAGTRHAIGSTLSGACIPERGGKSTQLSQTSLLHSLTSTTPQPSNILPFHDLEAHDSRSRIGPCLLIHRKF